MKKNIYELFLKLYEIELLRRNNYESINQWLIALLLGEILILINIIVKYDIILFSQTRFTIFTITIAIIFISLTLIFIDLWKYFKGETYKAYPLPDDILKYEKDVNKLDKVNKENMFYEVLNDKLSKCISKNLNSNIEKAKKILNLKKQLLILFIFIIILFVTQNLVKWRYL